MKLYRYEFQTPKGVVGLFEGFDYDALTEAEFNELDSLAIRLAKPPTAAFAGGNTSSFFTTSGNDRHARLVELQAKCNPAGHEDGGRLICIETDADELADLGGRISYEDEDQIVWVWE